MTRGFVSSFMCCMFVVPLCAPAQPAPKKHVLMLNSYRPGYEWTDETVRGILSVLQEERYETEVWVEYMDAVRLPGAQHLENLKRFYAGKYGGIPLDLVISSDDAALEFLILHHQELFPKVPVVFCGVNDPDRSRLQGRVLFTGLFEVFGTETILNYALQYHPSTQRVYVVTENSVPGEAQRTAMADALRKHSGIEAVFLDGRRLTLGEIVARLASAPAGGLVIMSAFRRDSTGAYYLEKEAHARLVSAAAAPVYSPSISVLGQGIVGGTVNGGFYHGRLAAGMATRILRGARPADIPYAIDDKNHYVFDYPQLQRWGITESRLPPDSLVVNRPDTFYERNRPRILGGIAFGALQSVVIAVLIINIQRRRRIESQLKQDIVVRQRTEEALRHSEERYRALVAYSSESIVCVEYEPPIPVNLPVDEQIDLAYRYGVLAECNQAAASARGYPDAGALVGKRLADFRNRQDPINLEMDRRIVQSGGRVVEVETHGLDRQGRTRCFLNNMVGIVQDGLLLRVWSIQRDITERKQTEEMVFNIARGVSAATGEMFFRRLVEHLSKALAADIAFVGELLPGRSDRVRSVAVFCDGSPAPNFEYDLVHTPCAHVVTESLCCYPQGVQQQFPQDYLLTEMGVDGYVGAPMADSVGNVLGLMVVLFRRPLENAALAKSTLQVFATRAAAEMERTRADRALIASRQSLQALSSRQESVREQERTRIAREIHDELGQQLTGLKFQLAATRKRLPEDPARPLANDFTEMSALVDTMIHSVRRIATELRPAVLDRFGVPAAIEWQAREFQARTGIRCDCRQVEEVTVPDELGTSVFRIFQEALTNVARHAGATQVRVTLRRMPDLLVLEVEDNGCGITPDQVLASGSLGLLGMRERTRIAGGELEIEGRPSASTKVTARFPLPAEMIQAAAPMGLQ